MSSTTAKQAFFIVVGLGFVGFGLLLCMRNRYIQSAWGLISAVPMILIGLAFVAVGAFGKRSLSDEFVSKKRRRSRG